MGGSSSEVAYSTTRCRASMPDLQIEEFSERRGRQARRGPPYRLLAGMVPSRRCSGNTCGSSLALGGGGCPGRGGRGRRFPSTAPGIRGHSISRSIPPFPVRHPVGWSGRREGEAPASPSGVWTIMRVPAVLVPRPPSRWIISVSIRKWNQGSGIGNGEFLRREVTGKNDALSRPCRATLPGLYRPETWVTVVPGHG
jgi:hypothetical protein